jgi:hypothetical protein
MTPQKDPVVVAIEQLGRKVDDLAARVTDHEKKLRWIVSVALLVVGAIGGPDAVQLVTGASV